MRSDAATAVVWGLDPTLHPVVTDTANVTVGAR